MVLPRNRERRPEPSIQVNMTLKLDELAPLDADRSKQADEEDSGSDDQDTKQLIHVSPDM